LVWPIRCRGAAELQRWSEPAPAVCRHSPRRCNLVPHRHDMAPPNGPKLSKRADSFPSTSGNGLSASPT